MKRVLFSISMSLALISCGQNKPMELRKDAVKKLEAFEKKPKFEVEKFDPKKGNMPYTGLGKPELKTTLSGLINKVASDFKNTALNAPTEKKFQDDINSGLKRFDPYYTDLDTEDREKICYYIQDIMDSVGLESSDGQLNKWMYGFDPKKNIKQ